MAPDRMAATGDAPGRSPAALRARVSALLGEGLRFANRLGLAGLDLIYPPSCMACRRAIQGAHGVCPSCWSAIAFIGPPVCERLGTPFAQDLGPGLISPEAIANPPVFDRARAVARFDDGPARALVHRLKYGDRPDFARVLGAWMARAGRELLADEPLIVPVPLHPRRLWQRRFNQAALLAQTVGRIAGAPVDVDALIRVKATKSQVGMSRTERADNIQGAFKVTPAGAARLHERRVLLIDDVLTTGSTVNAAARALRRGGASAVDVLVFARVVTGQ